MSIQPVGAAGNSIQDVNAILQMANDAQLAQAKKIMQVTVETALKGASTAGVGEGIDIAG